MNLGDAREAGKKGFNLRLFDVRRTGIEGEVHGTPQKRPGADDDRHADNKADGRVEPLPAREPDQTAGNHHTKVKHRG